MLKEELIMQWYHWLCPNFFETCCSHQIQEELIFLMKQLNVSLFVCFYVSLNKISVYDDYVLLSFKNSMQSSNFKQRKNNQEVFICLQQ